MIGQEAASAAALLRDFSTYEKPKETAAPLDMQSYKDAMLRGLRQQLPDYMVPSDLMLATDFPLTANGKLDRQKLQLQGEQIAHQRDGVGPIRGQCVTTAAGGALAGGTRREPRVGRRRFLLAGGAVL